MARHHRRNGSCAQSSCEEGELIPLHHLGRFLGTSLWVVPVLCILGVIGLALGTTAIDRYFRHGLIPRP